MQYISCFLEQARKLQATLVQNYDWLTQRLTGVRCRATSVSKKTSKTIIPTLYSVTKYKGLLRGCTKENTSIVICSLNSVQPSGQQVALNIWPEDVASLAVCVYGVSTGAGGSSIAGTRALCRVPVAAPPPVVGISTWPGSWFQLMTWWSFFRHGLHL